MALAAAALFGAGTLLNIKGQLDQGRASAQALRHRRVLLDIQAQEIEHRAQINNELIQRSYDQLEGQQKAGAAGSGVDVGTGSILAILEETQFRAAEEIMRNTRDAAFEAATLRYEGQLAEHQAKLAIKGSRIGAMGTLLTGAGQAYFAMGKPKLFGSSQSSTGTFATRNFSPFMMNTDSGASQKLQLSPISNTPGGRQV